MSVIIQADESGFGPGAGIALCEMEVLRRYRPDWPTATPADAVENFMYDERKPTLFYVYPPATANSYVELIYVKNPTDCAGLSSPIGLPDSYANAVLNGMLMRAAEKAQRFDVAAGYRAWMLESLGLKAKNVLAASPNVRNQGGAGVGGQGGG